MSAPLNLVNLERVHKAYGTTVILDDVSLGVAAGERIGVVGRNGGGKSTLLSLLTGADEPDSGRVTRRSDLAMGVLEVHTWNSVVSELERPNRLVIDLDPGARAHRLPARARLPGA